MTKHQQALAPAIRFPEFTSGWESHALSHYLAIKGERNSAGALDRRHVLSVSGDLGVVNQIEHLGRSYAGSDLGMYHVVDHGDVVYTKSPLKSAPYGIIRVNLGHSGLVSTLYAVYTVKPTAYPAFVGRFFELDDRANAYLRPLVNKGAKNDMKISSARVLIDPVTFPTISEQQKIAAFMDLVDERIVLLRRRRSALEQYKSAMMQRLFARTLRFARDDGDAFPDWEKRSFSDFVSRVPDKFDPAIERSSPVTIELENIEAGTGRIFGFSALEDQQSLKGVFRVGDILFGKLRPYLRKVWLADRDGICSSEIWVLRAKEAVPEFVFYLIQTERFMRFANQSSGSKMPRADWAVVGQSVYEIPHTDEQQKIGAFLLALDRKIHAVVAKVSAMQAFKKGLLQQMFV